MRLVQALKVTLATAAVAAGTVAIAPSAQAAGPGNCQWGDACFYYNSNERGGIYGFARATAHTTERFGTGWRGDNAGMGQYVKNNAASVANRYGFMLRVDYNSSNRCAYTCQFVQPWTATNLNINLKNNNAAHIWVGDWVEPY